MAMSVGILLFSFCSGIMGALLGIGGGMILIPALTLVFGLDIEYAVGASLVSVIATSCGSASIYLKQRLTNIRLATFLEVATTLGAVGGVLLSGVIGPKYLFLIFSLVLIQAAYSMFTAGFLGVKRKPVPAVHEESWMKIFSSSYQDQRSKKQVSYDVQRLPLGATLMAGAGMLSGLLGIGGGAFKVLAMDRIMGLPIKVSSATSSFMIGVTAATSATLYFFKGLILPEVAGPVAIGVYWGSKLGSRLLQHLSAQRVQQVFSILLFIIAIQMAFKGLSHGA